MQCPTCRMDSTRWDWLHLTSLIYQGLLNAAAGRHQCNRRRPPSEPCGSYRHSICRQYFPLLLRGNCILSSLYPKHLSMAWICIFHVINEFALLAWHFFKDRGDSLIIDRRCRFMCLLWCLTGNFFLFGTNAQTASAVNRLTISTARRRCYLIYNGNLLHRIRNSLDIHPILVPILIDILEQLSRDSSNHWHNWRKGRPSRWQKKAWVVDESS